MELTSSAFSPLPSFFIAFLTLCQRFLQELVPVNRLHRLTNATSFPCSAIQIPFLYKQEKFQRLTNLIPMDYFNTTKFNHNIRIHSYTIDHKSDSITTCRSVSTFISVSDNENTMVSDLCRTNHDDKRLFDIIQEETDLVMINPTIARMERGANVGWEELKPKFSCFSRSLATITITKGFSIQWKYKVIKCNNHLNYMRNHSRGQCNVKNEI